MDFYEAQAFRARNTPGLTIDDGRFIDSWLTSVRSQETQRVTSWVKEKRQQNRAKAKEVLERLNRIQDDLVTVRKQAERNEVPYTDLAKRQRKVAHERMALEKLYESLANSEENAKAMESDPLAYLESWYGRFPTLGDRRPNLAQALEEDRRKRGSRIA